MSKDQKKKYDPIYKLHEVLQDLKGKKFVLDCGHHVTFGHNLANDMVILNGSLPRIICTQCGL